MENKSYNYIVDNTGRRRPIVDGIVFNTGLTPEEFKAQQEGAENDSTIPSTQPDQQRGG